MGELEGVSMDFKALAQQYKSELLDKVMPFWMEHSIDREFGGYLHCLERDGSVFDTDKFVWMEGREVWMLSKLYNNISTSDGVTEATRQEWLAAAVQGAIFLRDHGHDGHLNWYFSLDRQGNALVEPYNIFSYTFAVIAFGQLSLALKKAEADGAHVSPLGGMGGSLTSAECADISKRTFDIVLSKVDNPKGRWNKAAATARPLKGFALPMILCNVALEIEHLVDPAFLKQTIDTCIHEVMDVFYQPELGLIVENVAPDGSLVDCMDGRQLNPGHAIEAMWFIMDLGKRLGRQDLIERACQIALNEAKYGWDEECGGIYYFLDRLGRPLQQLEWNQKLWWVHLETLITMLKGYQLTGNEECLAWFERVHDYVWSHFTDPDYPEWFGYLTREGKPLLSLKGGKWKGCFHVPRGLYNVWRMLETLA